VYKLLSSSMCNFFYSPVTSSLYGSNILLRTLFSSTLSLCSSLNVRDQVSHPYKVIFISMVLCTRHQAGRQKTPKRMVTSIHRVYLGRGRENGTKRSDVLGNACVSNLQFEPRYGARQSRQKLFVVDIK
jgi:hypothetical protein